MTKKKYCGYLVKLILLCAGILPFVVNSQITINAQLPPGGMVKKEQLWYLTLINNRDIRDVNIKLTLQDARSGQVLMSGNTAGVILGKGIKVLTNTDVQPVMYTYYTADLSGSFLPMGTYIACYYLYSIQGDIEQPIGNECIRFNIDPLNPPLLSTPADKSQSQTPYPLFTWMPPSPMEMFSNLSYDMIITEVLEGQSATEAAEYNTPVYAVSNLTRPGENYPAAYSKLETGKDYAWQVIAKNGTNYAVKTAVWTFTISKDIKPLISLVNDSYLLVENNLKGTYFVSNKKLHIKYTSFDKEHESHIIFSDAKGNKALTINKKVVEGDNYFDIDLNNRFQKGILYNLIITDLTGKSQVLLFSIK